MKLLISGNYDKNYNRNIIVFEGLIKNGVTLIHWPFEKKSYFNKNDFIKTAQQCDAVYLPSFTHNEVSYISGLTNLPLIFDPLISKYLTKVYDYKKINPFSIRALKNFYKDKRSMHKADIVLADTNAHKEYFSNNFNLAKEKIKVIPIGFPEQFFYPDQNIEPVKFKIGFYGSFAPLQGIENIIAAANILRENKLIQFSLVGSGFDLQKVRSKIDDHKLTNVQLEGQQDYKDLNQFINSFDICLGIFGDSLKSDLVIPNKIYHYMACKKAVITKESPAIRELFIHKSDIYLCDNDGLSIANSIRTLINDNDLKDKIALNAYNSMKENYSETSIGKMLKSVISSLIND